MGEKVNVRLALPDLTQRVLEWNCPVGEDQIDAVAMRLLHWKVRATTTSSNDPGNLEACQFRCFIIYRRRVWLEPSTATNVARKTKVVGDLLNETTPEDLSLHLRLDCPDEQEKKWVVSLMLQHFWRTEQLDKLCKILNQIAKDYKHFRSIVEAELVPKLEDPLSPTSVTPPSIFGNGPTDWVDHLGLLSAFMARVDSLSTLKTFLRSLRRSDDLAHTLVIYTTIIPVEKSRKHIYWFFWDSIGVLKYLVGTELKEYMARAPEHMTREQRMCLNGLDMILQMR